MENKKAKNLIIVVLLILLFVCLGFVIWQYINITSKNDITEGRENLPTNSEVNGSVTTNSEVVNLQAEITELKNKITQKDQEIANLKSENDQLKNSEDKVQTVIKNEYVRFNGDKVIYKGAYVNGCKLYQTSILYYGEDQRPEYYSMKINEKGEVEVYYKDNKTYKVKGFNKKAVELYAMSDSQQAVEGGIVIMEDGTIEQIYFDGNDFKTRGTIGTVKDVVRLIYITVNSQRYAAAVQANGDTVVLEGLKNYYNPGM